MKQDFDLHTHTTFCDGKNTAREMVISAIEKGLKTIGLSSHGYTFYDESYCMMPEVLPKYKEEVRGLKEEYSGEIDVLLGVEADLYSDEDLSDYDYVVGSTHYVRVDVTDFAGEIPEAHKQCMAQRDGRKFVFVPVDESVDTIKSAVETYFSGDRYAFAEAYFTQESEVIRLINPDVIGHFDLLTKFNEQEMQLEGKPYFDEKNPRYKNAWMSSIDKIISDSQNTKVRDAFSKLTGLTQPAFEINFGAIHRGYRTTPYPSAEIQDYIKSKGGALIYSSDSHEVETVSWGRVP